MIPLIDLRAYLGIEPGVEEEQSKLIVAEFNRMKLGFVVDAVDRIYRINSEELDASLTGTFLGDNALYVIKREGRNILLLDYERIVQVVNPAVAEQFKMDEGHARKITASLGDPNQYKILVAEDSPLRKGASTTWSWWDTARPPGIASTTRRTPSTCSSRTSRCPRWTAWP